MFVYCIIHKIRTYVIGACVQFELLKVVIFIGNISCAFTELKMKE